MIDRCRIEAERCYKIKTTPFHFNVAVCNKYFKGEKHEIAAHTGMLLHDSTSLVNSHCGKLAREMIYQ